MMLAECVTPAAVCQKEFYIPTDQPFACFTLYRPMQELQQSRYPFIDCPQFHVMAWGFRIMSLSGSNMVLPSSNQKLLLNSRRENN
jgi:hypothetical protein